MGLISVPTEYSRPDSQAQYLDLIFTLLVWAIVIYLLYTNISCNKQKTRKLSFDLRYKSLFRLDRNSLGCRFGVGCEKTNKKAPRISVPGA